MQSFIFNDFTYFFALRVVERSTKVFALTAVIIGHRSHHTPNIPFLPYCYLPFASFIVIAQIDVT